MFDGEYKSDLKVQAKDSLFSQSQKPAGEARHAHAVAQGWLRQTATRISSGVEGGSREAAAQPP